MDNTNMQPNQEITKKKKWLLPVILGVAALLVIGLGVGGFIYIKSVALPKKEVQRKLDLGDKYLTDMDYEKAVLSYKEAITIDPKNIKAYVGLGDAYLAWADELVEEGNTEEAIKKLKKGIKELKLGINETGSDEVKEKKEELENKKKEMEGGTDDKEEKKSSKKEEKSETEPVDNEAEKLAKEKEVYQAYYNFLSSDTGYRIIEEYSNVQISSVAFGDCYGDSLPEMFYLTKFKGEYSPSGYKLHMVTYENGSIIEKINDIEFDQDVAGSMHCCLFKSGDSKVIYGISDCGDDWWMTDVFIMKEGTDGYLHKEILYTEETQYSDYDHSPIMTYYKNGNPDSKENFYNEVHSLIRDVEVLYWCDHYTSSYYQDSLGLKSNVKQVDCMKYDEAIAYLQGKITQ